MKVLVDNGIIRGSTFLVGDFREDQLTWGDRATSVNTAGFRRVPLDEDADQQREKDALFTVGSLVRSGHISLYTYPELTVESWRGGYGRNPYVNALRDCQFEQCPAPIERSKFRQTTNMQEWFAKGGRSDAKKGLKLSDFNQLPYIEWLSALSPVEIRHLSDHAGVFKLNEFEVASLEDLPWFQEFCRVQGSRENLPDCFHVWAARRNGLNALLTLEKKLPRRVEQMKNSVEWRVKMNVDVVRPTSLLRQMGIDSFDPVPVEPNRFYTFAEVFQIDGKLLR